MAPEPTAVSFNAIAFVVEASLAVSDQWLRILHDYVPRLFNRLGHDSQQPPAPNATVRSTTSRPYSVSANPTHCF
jgi:hypothetical protein